MWRRVSRVAGTGGALAPWRHVASSASCCCSGSSVAVSFGGRWKKNKTDRGFASQSTQHQAWQVDPALIEIDQSIVGFRAPPDWQAFQYPEKITKLAQEILALPKVERSMLVEYLKGQHQVPDWAMDKKQQVVYVQAAGAPAAAQAAPAEPEAAPPPPKEKSSFKIVLTAVPDDAKIKVLKEVRVIKPGMKLLESKALVDKMPSLVKEDVPKAEAEEWKKKLTEAGATVELQ